MMTGADPESSLIPCTFVYVLLPSVKRIFWNFCGKTPRIGMRRNFILSSWSVLIPA